MSGSSDQKRPGRSKVITLRGVVIPVDWDEQGNVARIALSTHDEDEYLIHDDELGNTLRGLINEEVEVSGHSRKRKTKKVVIVETYKRIREELPGENNRV
jgi:hypothetical protein